MRLTPGGETRRDSEPGAATSTQSREPRRGDVVSINTIRFDMFAAGVKNHAPTYNILIFSKDAINRVRREVGFDS